MGVKGLWQLIASSGTPVSLESLENKILSVDVSIWLHQSVRGFKKFGTDSVANAHLLTLFHRICKLLFYRIRPIFVFDGGVPQLKKQTMSSRRLRREAAAGKVQKVRERLLSNLLRSEAVRKALGKKGPAPSNNYIAKPIQREKDMFDLPPLNEPLLPRKGIIALTELDDSEEEKEYISNKLEHKNLHNFEFDDKEFKSLPLQKQHEILTELQSTRKENSWHTMNEMPQESNNFSSFQMKRLLKRKNFQATLDNISSEIQKSSAAEMEAQLFGDLERYVSHTNKIVSEESSHSILIKNINDKPTAKSETINDIIVERKKESSKKSIAKKDFLSELARQGIVKEKTENDSMEYTDLSSSESDTDEFSDDELYIPLKKKRKMEEAAFLKAVDYALDDSELSQEEILSLIKQSQTEIEMESKNKDNDDHTCNKVESWKKSNLSEPSTSKNASGIVYNSEAESSTDDEDFVEVPIESDEDEKQSILSNISEKTSLQTETISNEKAILDAKYDSPYLKISQQKLNSPLKSKHSSNDSRTNHKSTENFVSSNALGFSNTSSDGKVVPIDLNFITKKSGLLIKDDIFKDILKKEKKSSVLPQNKEIFAYNSKECNSYDIESTSKIDNFDLQTINEVNTDSNEQLKAKLTELVGAEILKMASCSTLQSQSSYSLDQRFKLDKDIRTSQIAKENGTKGEGISSNKYFNPVDEIQDLEHSDGNDLKICNLDTQVKELKTGTNQVINDRSNILSNEKKVDISVNMVASDSCQALDVNKSEKGSAIYSKQDTVIPCHIVDNGDNSEKEIIASMVGSKQTHVQNNEENSNDSSSFSSNGRKLEIEQPLKYSGQDLQKLESELLKEQKILFAEANSAERVAVDISNQVYGEAQELLQLFGLPYIVAPMEAEAQCAFLDSVGLSNGTITDDSDIFLFGGKKVYKNFFNRSKHVECFTLENITYNFGLTRDKMINLALLTGSDYTVGIESVGAVSGMEILSEFPGAGIQCLRNLKKWWKNASSNVSARLQTKTKQRLFVLHFPESFPNENIFKAYLNPDVDESREKFTWAVPNAERLKSFTAEKFGWSYSKTNEIIIPVFKNLGLKETQMRIDSYFSSIKLVKDPGNRSKRLQEAIDRAKGGSVDGKSRESNRYTFLNINRVTRGGKRRGGKRKKETDEISEDKTSDASEKPRDKQTRLTNNDNEASQVTEQDDEPISQTCSSGSLNKEIKLPDKEKKKLQNFQKLLEKEKILQTEKEQEEKNKKKAAASLILSQTKKEQRLKPKTRK